MSIATLLLFSRRLLSHEIPESEFGNTLTIDPFGSKEDLESIDRYVRLGGVSNFHLLIFLMISILPIINPDQEADGTDVHTTKEKVNFFWKHLVVELRR